MMTLTTSKRRQRDSIVPMINVAFLLLVFFLMVAVIAPPDVIDVTPPVASAAEGTGDVDTLLVDASGNVHLGPLTGQAALDAVLGNHVRIRADAELPAAKLARLLGQFRARGVTTVEIVTIDEGA